MKYSLSLIESYWGGSNLDRFESYNMHLFIATVLIRVFCVLSIIGSNLPLIKLHFSLLQYGLFL